MKRQAIWLLLSVGLTLTGCAEGKHLSVPEAQQYLAKNEPKLLQIVEKLENCQPSRTVSAHYNAVHLRDSPNQDPACVSDSTTSIASIKEDMRALGIVTAYVDFDAENAAPWATFTLYSEGLSVSSRSTSLVWASRAGSLKEEKTSEYELLSLNPNPSHWYWKHWDN